MVKIKLMSWLNFQLCIYCIASIYKYYIEWIIKNQFGRRNLPAYERAKLALRLEPIIREKAKERQGSRNDLNITQKSAESKPKEMNLVTN